MFPEVEIWRLHSHCHAAEGYQLPCHWNFTQYTYICKWKLRSRLHFHATFIWLLSVSLLSPRLFLELDMFECICAAQFKRLKALNTSTPSSTIALRTNEIGQDWIFFFCSKAIGSIEVRSSDCLFFYATNKRQTWRNWWHRKHQKSRRSVWKMWISHVCLTDFKLTVGCFTDWLA